MQVANAVDAAGTPPTTTVTTVATAYLAAHGINADDEAYRKIHGSICSFVSIGAILHRRGSGPQQAPHSGHCSKDRPRIFGLKVVLV